MLRIIFIFSCALIFALLTFASKFVRLLAYLVIILQNKRLGGQFSEIPFFGQVINLASLSDNFNSNSLQIK